MTVISTLITKYCTVHASDSFLTVHQPNGQYEVVESTQSKIIPVPKFRGAMSYWGLASSNNWSAYSWLHEQTQSLHQNNTAEEFANAVAEKLDLTISAMQFSTPNHYGIGIHFTAYEHIGDYWIPELFLITNWTNTQYNRVHTKIGVSRESFHTIGREDPKPEHRQPEYRLHVHKHLQDGGFLIYNNGDPKLFNTAASAIFGMIGLVSERGLLVEPTQISTYLKMARRPVDIVSVVQRDFCQEGKRVVGGKAHDLAVTPTGDYSSTTGDV